MLGVIFGGLVKNLERAARSVSQDLVASAGEEIGELFDKKLYPLASEMDYMVQRRLEQVDRVSEKTATEISDLEEEFKEKFDDLLGDVDEKYKDNLNLTLEGVNRVRASSIADLRALLGEVDTSLERQVNQISLVMMGVLKQVKTLGDRFTPDILKAELIAPTFTKLEALEEKIYLDAEKIIDRIDEVATKTNEELKNNFLKRLLEHALPNPFDECRRRLKIAGKIGPSLSDIQLYELTECHELSKLNEKTPIDEVVKIYEELQLNAAKMAALAKQVPSRRKRAIQDWLKYGVLCEFWRNTIKADDSTNLLALAPEIPQKLLTSQEDG